MSFYTTGGTVQAGDGIYLQRPADTELLQLCQAGEFAYILTARQMGKSSLMGATADSLRQQNVLPLVLDLQSIGTEATAEQWYFGLLIELEKDLEENHGISLSVDLVDWWQAHENLGMTQRFTLFFRDVLLQDFSQPIVIFVDEIDTTLSLSFTDDFFIAIRYFYTARAQAPEFNRLSFVLLGAAMPGDLIKDSQRTPFNIGSRLELADFTLQEALPLAKGLDLTEAKAQQVLEWVLHWTGGHPYLTQRLCQVLVEESAKEKQSTEQPFDWTKAGVEQVVRRTFLEGGDRSDRNLQFVRDRLLTPATNTVNTEDLLRTYRDIWQGKRVEDDERSLVKSHLKLSGIVKQLPNHTLTVRNHLYRQVFNRDWINENLPETWFQRYWPVLRVVVPISALIVGLFYFFIESRYQRSVAQLEKIQADVNNSKLFFSANQPLEGMMSAVQIWQTVEKNNLQTLKESVFAHSALIQSTYYNHPFNLNNSLSFLAEDYRQSFFSGFREKSSVRVSVPRKGLVASSANLETVVTTDPSGNIAIWERGQLLGRLRLDETSSIRKVALSPEGTVIALAQRSGRITLWSRDGEPLGEPIIVTADLRDITFTPGGEALVTEDQDGEIRLLDYRNGNRIAARFDQGARLKDLAFSPDSKVIAVAREDGKVRLWTRLKASGDAEEDTFQASVVFDHATEINKVAFSSQGDMVASVGTNGTVKLWKLDDNEALPTLCHSSSQVLSVAFNPDGNTVATGSEDGTIQIWDRGGRLLQTLEGHRNSVTGIVFNPEGDTLTSYSRDTTIKQWNRKGSSFKNIELHEFSNGVLAFSPDGRMVASASNDGVVKLIDWQASKHLYETTLSDEASAIAFHPDNNVMALGNRNGKIELWNYREDTRQPLGEHTGVVGIAFAPKDDAIVSVGADGVMKRWNSQTQTAETFDVPEGVTYVTSVAFDKDVKRIAIASGDDTVRLLTRKGQQINQLERHNNIFSDLAFSPDGEILAWASADGTTTLWNQKGRHLQTLEGHNDVVLSVAFSADGRLIATSGNDGSLRLWNREGDLLNILDSDQNGQRTVATGIVFSPVETILATQSDIGFLGLWELDPQRLLEWNCNWLQEHLRLMATGQEKAARDFCQPKPEALTNWRASG